MGKNLSLTIGKKYCWQDLCENLSIIFKKIGTIRSKILIALLTRFGQNIFIAVQAKNLPKFGGKYW